MIYYMWIPKCVALHNVYMQELSFHVEECLSRNLHVRCYGFVQNVLHTTTQHLQGEQATKMQKNYELSQCVYITFVSHILQTRTLIAQWMCSMIYGLLITYEGIL